MGPLQEQPCTMTSNKSSLVRAGNTNYLIPFVLITSLFFLWGFAHALLDVLNKHFQNVLGVSKAESGLVQAAVYGGYFLAALPAGLFIKKYGFKTGILSALALVAFGSLLFVPAAAYIRQFWSFLLPLFILACGLAGLETAANPYTTVLGPRETAESRINLAQSFNAVGWIVGPLVGSFILLSGSNKEGGEFTSLAIPYLGLALFVIIVAFVFFRMKLPEVAIGQDASKPDARPKTGSKQSIFAQRHFVMAVVAQFFYVAAQTGVNSFFINYVTETIPGISDAQAGYILGIGGMGMFFLGRLSGSFLMRRFDPGKLLFSFAFINIFLMLLVTLGLGWWSVAALFSCYFFMSIMFPTIFALGIRDLGNQTKRASSFIVMAIVGGAVAPVFMGYVGDHYGIASGFWIPLLAFGVVAYYGMHGHKVLKNASA